MAAAASQSEPRSRKPPPLPAHPDFFKLLLDNMQVGVIVSDHEGTIVYINETYARFLGIDAAAQIGKHATEVTANSRLHIVARTGVMEINHPHQFKDKGFLVHRVPIREKGRVIAVLGLVLFEDADTASKLAEKVTFLESKLALYERELESFYAARYTFDNIVGVSNLLSEVKREARKAAGNRLPVLITGESGTGKELFAQAIHYGSSRKTRPFVRVNCAAIPKDLFESELFGYEKGAYTGADPRGKPGKFELAHKGSIFLDEIGDLPLDLQPKLLRVLELKEFERVGGSRLIRSDFRLIAATNQNILKMVEEGRFRKDLYYRLSVIPIAVPSLRERREDIIPLAHHLLDRSMEGGTVRMAPDAQACVEAYDWPGNVRELMNVMERAVAFIEAETIGADDLPYYIRRSRSAPKAALDAPLKKQMNRAERTAIEEALAAAGNNKSLAARKLGIHRTLLYRKMRHLGIR